MAIKLPRRCHLASRCPGGHSYDLSSPSNLIFEIQEQNPFLAIMVLLSRPSPRACRDSQIPAPPVSPFWRGLFVIQTVMDLE